MVPSNYKKSKEVKKKLEKEKNFSDLKDLFLPVTSYIGSLITIFSLKFLSSGKFSFNSSAIFDWLFLVFLLFVLYAGFNTISKNSSKKNVLVVSKENLEHLITVERFEAENSIYSICGDLSWLERDKEELIELTKVKKNLTIKILYTSSANPKTKILMNELITYGIDFIEYENFEDRSKCNYLLVDQETDSAKAIVIYKKIDSSSTKTSEEKFTWTVASGVENPSLAFVKRFIQLNDVISNVPIKVGICGVNNVGKTNLIKACEKVLSSPPNMVKIFDDEFENYKSTDVYSNVTILHKQFAKQQFRGNKLCIYDRTSIDNYLYFKCRASIDNEKNEKNYPKVEKIFIDYYEEVNKTMEELDLLVMVVNENTNEVDTTFVNSDLKKQVNTDLVKYMKHFKNKNKPTLTVSIQSNNFEESITNARDQVCSAIREVSNLKSKSRIKFPVDKTKNDKPKESKRATLISLTYKKK